MGRGKAFLVAARRRRAQFSGREEPPGLWADMTGILLTGTNGSGGSAFPAYPTVDSA